MIKCDVKLILGLTGMPKIGKVQYGLYSAKRKSQNLNYNVLNKDFVQHAQVARLTGCSKIIETQAFQVKKPTPYATPFVQEKFLQHINFVFTLLAFKLCFSKELSAMALHPDT